MDLEIVKANRAKLVAALRSGEYKQCTGTISRDENGVTGISTAAKSEQQTFCCLGVAASILANSRMREDMAKFVARAQDPLCAMWGVLTPEACTAFGFKDEAAEETPEMTDQRRLAQMNDVGATFETIANEIERMPYAS